MRAVLTLVLLASGLFFQVGRAADDGPVKTLGPVERLQSGFVFTEGPAWDGDGNLYFTDIPNNRIMHWREGEEATAFIEPSMHANGLMVEAGGLLVACQMDGEVVAYDVKTKQATTLAAEFDGKRFNAPNDLVIDAAGGLYFTDPLYRAPTPLPQGAQAVYYVAADGKVNRVTGDLPAPNGIGLSPDGKRLYVIPSMSAEMMVYEVLEAGKLGEGKVFCRLLQREADGNTGGDGITLDTQGNLYITTDLGVQVFSPAGEHVLTIDVPEKPANVAFGGKQGDELFITAVTGLYRVKLSTQGLKPGKLARR